ncbi:MAG: phosphopentomutase, partial [Alphaproteobacteria bacterium]|nr:phosphopentomutase [Alphaproteobacteria bacterium]
MKRAIILMMDSFGCGEAPDAEAFGDTGADTLGHIAKACAEGKAEKGRTGPLNIPNLCKLGLGELYKQCNGEYAPNLEIPVSEITGVYGFSKEISKGKDTTSGHWEMAGAPVMFKWGYFPAEYPSFPQDLIDEFVKEAKLPGVLGNKAASGTVILDELGAESVRTGKPIVYTSADSVFQICAHERYFGLERLYEICHIARDLLNKRTENGLIARVIARPFEGEIETGFKRTGGRHDYSVLPPAPTVLDKMKKAGGNVISIGKISDIFAAQG